MGGLPLHVNTTLLILMSASFVQGITCARRDRREERAVRSRSIRDGGSYGPSAGTCIGTARRRSPLVNLPLCLEHLRHS
jgi:hypothetical protein